ncbi:hypothetical protein BU17DRAFT_81393 [Hysterangium stoloniferum]|nr:hypothetical protein BU17DRAFT_81393 [Hysterangium stoloniferum]
MPPPPAKPAPIKLVFTTTSLRNVTIATELDEHYYEIVTPAWEAGCTKIKRLHSDSGQIAVIAELKKDDENSPKYSGLRFIGPKQPEADFGSPEAFLGTTDQTRKMLVAPVSIKLRG